MSSRILVTCFTACMLWLCHSPVDAAPWPALDDAPQVTPTETPDVAVVVGVQDYLLLPDIPGAIANVNDWELFFRRGLKVPTVHVLSNRDVTRESMLKFARTAAEDVGEGGTIWWVFIGHGAPAIDGEEGLLVGVDAQQSVESLAARGLPQSDLLEALQADRHDTVVILDACFSGRASDGAALAAGVQPVVAVRPDGELGEGSVLLSAAKATEVAGQLHGTKRPAFSYLLLGAMRGWADDGDGAVTVEEALVYTRRQLRGARGRQQTPQASGDLGLVLTRGVTETEPAVVAETAPCAGGETMRDGECVTVDEPAPTREASEAERTLDYLNRRLVFDGQTVRQGGRILDGPAFYHAIGRPDLAANWKSHNPALWIPGIATTAAGVFLMVYGISRFGSDASDAAQIGWFFGGVMGGSLTLAGGVVMITFGFMGDKEPMSFSERKSAAEAHNKKLRQERGLGPEVDRQDEPQAKPGFGPFSGSGAPRGAIGVTLRF